MKGIDFIAQVRALGIELWVEGEKLRISAPPGIVTNELLAELKRHKKEVLALMQLCGGSTTSPQNEPILPVARDIDVPLSWAQQRLWLLNQIEPESTAYNIAAHLKLSGRLDAVALEKSLDEIIRRHESLRTVFIAKNGEPVQVVKPHTPSAMEIVDISRRSAAECWVEVQRLSRQEADHVFRLEDGPLLRMLLVKVDDTSHVLLLTLHHIVFDGWSIGVFMRELEVLYNALSTGMDCRLPELTVQYADYAYWQRRTFTDAVLEQQLAYWRRELSDHLPLINLPLDRPRPREQLYRGAFCKIKITRTLLDALHELSRQNGATIFMTLLSAFNLLLMRHSGDEEILVGTPIANRNRTEVEGLIGFFLNTLVIRSDLGGNPPFLELLARVREKTLNAYSNQDIPFERLLEELKPVRDPSRAPLFQVMFVLQNAPFRPIQINQLTLEALETEIKTTKFDLELTAIETGDGLVAVLNYNTDLFDAERIEMMLEQYESLLNQITVDSNRKITTYSLLTDAQKRQIQSRQNLVSPTNDFIEFPEEEIEQSIAKRFEAQLEKHSQKIAVKTIKYEWTYEHLNQIANHVATILLKKCGSRPRRVGLLFEQDAPMVAGILGTIKAGNTYVPLDPTYPVQRLGYMAEDSQVEMLLTNDINLPLAKKLTGESVALINIDEIDFSGKIDNQSVYVDPDSLAYILYTSGSTGRPKGIMQNHRNVLHFIRVYTNALHISHEDRLTLISSYSFDAAVMDIYGALLNGATLYPVNIREEGLINLPSWLMEQKVSIYHSTPTVYRAFLDTLSESDIFPQVRLIILGGEAVYKRDVDSYKRYFGAHCLFVNGFGPTESTVSVQYFLDRQTEVQKNRVPIGYAVEETEILLLNRYGNYDDVHGEIAIRSPYVALGYWNKSEETENAFLPDPDGGKRRVYRTGDLGRWQPNGSLEFLGRRDFQVKIRGYRIETAEIENNLLEHPEIKSVSVVTKMINGESRLVAYIVTHKVQALDDLNLRQFLQAKLPNFMIPSAFVKMDYLPLTPTNKIDRKKLEQLEVEYSGPLIANYVAAQSQIEQSLVEIWSKLLDVLQVGIYDDFFDLGGHSLLAVQMVSRIRQAFDVEISLRSLFENPTVSGLAATIEQKKCVPDAVRLTPILPVPRNQRLPLSSSQERLWFLFQLEPENTAYHISGGVRLEGQLRVDLLEQSLSEILRRHEALRTTFEEIEGRPVQVISPEAAFDLPVVDLQELPEAEREARSRQIISEESQCPFDLSAGPLFRAVLMRLGQEEHILVVVMHHIITDGWSLGVFTRELEALYAAFSEGKPSPLPDLPVQYADYAAWQRERLQGEVLEGQVAYWKEQLAGELTQLQLPTDRPRPAVQTHRGARHAFDLPKGLAEKINYLSRQQGVTLFMTLLAAFKVLLYRYTGQTDFAVGSPIANRTRSELEGLIGFFVSTLVLRTDMAGDPGFIELLGRVRETTLGAYDHHELPFEKLVEVLNPVRDMSYSPLFQVMFVLQNMPGAAVQLPGVRLSPVGTDAGASMFDLTLFMWEGEKGLSGRIEYNTDLFDAETIVRMVGHFEVLLESAATDPSRRISELELLTEVERHKLLVEWNATGAEYPADKTLVQLFEEQVERSPEAVAVEYEGTQLTYREFDARANQLAHYLQARGVGRESRVGIWMERSLDMMVALMGTLKTGGAYVPLDPNYPQERLAFMLGDSQVPVLLTAAKFLGDIPEYAGQVVCKDRDWGAISTESGENPISGITPDCAAYVIYTSGSTGIPKGVIGLHRGAVNRLNWMWRAYPFKDSEVCCQKTYLSFVDSVWEIFGPLLQGVRAVIVPDDAVNDPHLLVESLAANHVSRIVLVPSLLRVLLDSFGDLQKRLPELRLWVTSGEEIPLELAKRFREVMPQARLINLYGSSEVSADVTSYEIGGDLQEQRVPIGRPIDNTQVYLLDADLQPVPVGVHGELYVGGAGLARGYLNREDLTAERFIGSPFQPGEVLFKTGDLGRYLTDGNIEYLGRRDHQVKIRGFRVELGEIESRIKEAEAVSNCVVVLREDRPGDQRLTAYYVPRDGQAVSVFEVRRHLQSKLPEYMVPQHYVELESIPLTPNGKVDRKALPKPETDSASEQGYVAPRTETEQKIAGVWQEVLNREKVGVRDDFFELGGHSLLATQVVSRINHLFKMQLPLRRFFEGKTIEALAEVIDIALWNAQDLQGPIIPGIEEREVIEL